MNNDFKFCNYNQYLFQNEIKIKCSTTALVTTMPVEYLSAASLSTIRLRESFRISYLRYTASTEHLKSSKHQRKIRCCSLLTVLPKFLRPWNKLKHQIKKLQTNAEINPLANEVNNTPRNHSVVSKSFEMSQ